MSEETVYDIDRGLKQCEERLRRDTKIPDTVKKEILRFTKALNRQKVSKHRQYFYIERLKIPARVMGSRFLAPKESDVNDAIDLIMEMKTRRKGNYSDRALSDIVYSLKRFYRDYEEGKYLNAVSKLKFNIHPSRDRKPEDVVSKEELNKMLSACFNERDKSLISMLYDSGCRIGELLTMRVKDVEYDDYGMILTVSGKTGLRKVRVVGDSVALAHQYQDRFKRKNGSENFFVNMKNKPMKYNEVNTMFYKVCRRAGIERRIHPHLFRHTRATILAKDLREAPLERTMGWVHGSRMTKIYVNLSDEQVDSAVLKVYGIEKKEGEGKIEPYVPKVCMRCGTQNPTVNDYCFKCGLPLDKNKLVEYEEAKKGAKDLILTTEGIDKSLKDVVNAADPEFDDKILNAVYSVIDRDPKLKEALKKRSRSRKTPQ